MKIEKEKGYLLYPSQETQKQIKQTDMQEYGSIDSYNLAMKYETALAGLLSQDRKEIIKSFNKLEYLLVDIDIINFNYNSTALVLASYYNNNELLQYHLEIYKLFIFYKQPVHQWIKNLINKPEIALEGKIKKLYDDDLLKNLQLFPRFGLLCEKNLTYLQGIQSTYSIINAMNAKMYLWSNTDK